MMARAIESLSHDHEEEAHENEHERRYHAQKTDEQSGQTATSKPGEASPSIAPGLKSRVSLAPQIPWGWHKAPWARSIMRRVGIPATTTVIVHRSLLIKC